jgi:TPR repeat protein
MKKKTFLVLCSLVSNVIYGQSDLWFSRASECADTNYTPSVNDKANRMIITQILQKIEHPHLIDIIRVRECAGINNCITKKFNKNRNLVFILYDNTFINNRKKSVRPSKEHQTGNSAAQDWVTMGILAHELGHILCRHVDDSLQMNPHQSELQADEWIGIALRKMGASLEQAQQCMQASLPDNHGGTHPPLTQRLAAIERGYYRFDLQKAIKAFRAGDATLAYKLLINKELELDAEAYWCLGQLQESGHGGAVRDTFDAMESYEKAIKSDSTYCPAYEGLAGICRAEPKMVLKWQIQAAWNACPKALVYMGYEMEQAGRDSDAAQFYKKATLQNEPQAWHNLAFLYEKGKGVLPNTKKALEYYRKAAQLGCKQSIKYLRNRGEFAH